MTRCWIGTSSVFPAYKYYRQAVEESRKLATSLDAGSSPLLPREIVEEERKIANQGIERLKQDIQTKDEQLHNAETRIRELQDSGPSPCLSCGRILKLPQKRYYVVISKQKLNAPKHCPVALVLNPPQTSITRWRLPPCTRT